MNKCDKCVWGTCVGSNKYLCMFPSCVREKEKGSKNKRTGATEVFQMTNRKVIALANVVADELGIEIDDEKILKAIGAQNAIPVIIDKNEYQLWIDAHYVAYSKKDEKSVKYIYMDLHHVKEQKQDILSMLKRNKQAKANVGVLKNILNQMLNAEKNMDSTRKKFFIRKKYVAKIV